MCGTLIKIGTWYAWNVSHIGDQACLERFSMGTRHAWNVWKFLNAFYTNLVHFSSNLIGPINSFFLWRIILANQIGPKVYEVHRKRIWKFPSVPGMSSPHRKAFQACLVPNETNVPGIPGPFYYRCSLHTQSPLYESYNIIEKIIIFRCWKLYQVSSTMEICIK